MLGEEISQPKRVLSVNDHNLHLLVDFINSLLEDHARKISQLDQ